MEIFCLDPLGINGYERKANEVLTEALPSSWKGYSSLEMVGRQSGDFEADIILITHDRIIVIELKNYAGKIFSDGKKWIQEKPNGLAQAFVIGEDFIGKEKVCLVLGDNIFHGGALDYLLTEHNDPDGSVIFAYHVKDPERYGVVDFDDKMNAVSIEEKPINPRSNYAVPGLYFYDNTVIDIAKSIKPSARGEYEISDVNAAYLKQGKLKVGVLDRGTAWLDTGTFHSLMQASQFVQVVEERQGLKVGCIEEVAFKKGFISRNQLIELAKPLNKSGYGSYLIDLTKEK